MFKPAIVVLTFLLILTFSDKGIATVDVIELDLKLN